MAFLASLIYDIACLLSLGLLDGAMMVLLVATLLGVGAWWFATCLPPP
jgi:hypothetical protein